jgi:DNA-binding CsgD family transcriptional regulator
MSSPYRDPLSRREREILNLIAAGRTSRQIAADLGIAWKTVVCHRTRIMQKLGLHRTADVVRYAITCRQDLPAAEQELLEQEALSRLREAENAWRMAGQHYKDVVARAGAASWKTDADYQAAVCSADREEREALKKYAAAVEVLAELVLKARQGGFQP